AESRKSPSRSPAGAAPPSMCPFASQCPSVMSGATFPPVMSGATRWLSQGLASADAAGAMPPTTVAARNSAAANRLPIRTPPSVDRFPDAHTVCSAPPRPGASTLFERACSGASPVHEAGAERGGQVMGVRAGAVGDDQSGVAQHGGVVGDGGRRDTGAPGEVGGGDALSGGDEVQHLGAAAAEEGFQGVG